MTMVRITNSILTCSLQSQWWIQRCKGSQSRKHGRTAEDDGNDDDDNDDDANDGGVDTDNDADDDVDDNDNDDDLDISVTELRDG